jgi:hypothetical protein
MDIEKKISIKNFIKDLTVSEVVDFFGSLKNVSKILGYESILNLYGATDNGHPDYIFYDGVKQTVTNDFNFGDWTSINKIIWDSGQCFHTNITNLSNMQSTSGNFGIYDLVLTNFGGLEIHNGDFIVGHDSTIIIWDTLKNVLGNLVIYETACVESLGNLKIVGGKLDIRGVVHDLGELEYVGGDLIVKNKLLKSLGNVKHIKGRLRIRNSGISDIGSLEKVDGGVLIDKNTPTSLINQLKERNIKYKK